MSDQVPAPVRALHSGFGVHEPGMPRLGMHVLEAVG